ncbi:uncharacterized protein BXZ73DRAFT_49390 [Epithele typhae]|uniref:uncharacterized protein n=1 Tax=Epithele typhae TaxID=378194 RepID=UPI002008E6C3|nr:uncharacterized protein BXZ73DRAFT_49390 [Epithele typhae]KAH9926599.1 hypothetical protein BXZ73DRAFT_49390 [Epithele typhae]
MSKYAPSDYERVCYYSGIAVEGECPELIYRSDCLTTPFRSPTGRFATPIVKSIYSADDTPLGKIWATVLDEIHAIVKTAVPSYSCIDADRFYTHGPNGFIHNPDGVTDGGSLGPAVVWVGVPPGSTSADTAHDVSQTILALLHKNGVDNAVVEWRGAVVLKFSGPSLLRSTDRTDATFQVRHFLTNALSIPLTTKGLEEDDSSGTMTMFFHVVKDAGGLTDKVYGLSSCHVLRDDWKTTYEFKDGDDEDHVRVCSMRRFQRGLKDIMKAGRDALFTAELAAGELIRHEKTQDTTPEGKRKERRLRQECERTSEDIADLRALHDKVAQEWSNTALHRNVGHVVYAPAIRADVGDTRYTADWGVFEAAKAKFHNGYEGNVVFLGKKFSPNELKEMFSRGTTEFKFPDDGKLPLTNFAGKISLSLLPERDSLGNRCLTVGKDGNSTDFTVGRFTGLESFTQNDAGFESKNYAVYNSGYNSTQPFSGKGDSGSAVWYANGSEGHIVGQLHSGATKDGTGGSHVSYLTPGWWLQSEIGKVFPHADFFRKAW